MPLIPHSRPSLTQTRLFIMVPVIIEDNLSKSLLQCKSLGSSVIRSTLINHLSVAGSSSGAGMSWNAEASGQASSSRMQLPPRPATSMNYYQSTSFAMPPPPLPSSSSRRTFAEPSPHYPPSGQPPASFMPPPPASYGMPPPQQYQHPQQYQQPPNYPQAPSSSTYQYMPTAAGRSFTPVHLPPLQQYDGYVTESGTSRRERRVQLPGFSEIARQNQQPSDPNRRHYQVSFRLTFCSSADPSLLLLVT